MITIVCKPIIEYSQNQIVSIEDFNEDEGESDSETENDLFEYFDFLALTNYKFTSIDNKSNKVIYKFLTQTKISKGFPFKFMNPPEL